MDIEEIKKTRFWVGAILFNLDTRQMLMQKRDAIAPVNPSKWAFFGGVGESGENPEQCLVRELQEELGVDVSQVHFSPFRDDLHEKQMVWRYVYSAEFLFERSQMTLGEGEDFDWVPFDDVSKLDITENTRLDVEYFLRSYRR